MAVDIEELILAPFRELVARAKEAVDNAEVAADENEVSKAMSKAAKGVVREGERALKRLQPLWDSQVEKYGDSFKMGMAKNEEVERKRRKLEDLLYDFEDYVEIDTFDEDRYLDIQAAAKSLALDVLDIIKRLKIDGVPISPPPKQPTFPPLPLLPANISLNARPPSSAGPKSAMKAPQSPPPAVPMRSTKRLSIGSGRKGTSELRKLTQQLARSDTMASRTLSQISVDSLPPYSSNRDSLTMPLPLDVNGPLEVCQQIDSPQPPPVHAIVLDLRPTTPKLPGAGSGSSSVQVTAEPEPISPATAKTEGSSVMDIPSFPLPRTTAWVSDQAMAPTSPRMAARQAPLSSMMGTTIPENEALTTVRAAPTSGANQTQPVPLDASGINFHFEHPSSSVLSKLSRFSLEEFIAPGSSLDSSSIDANGGPVSALPARSATTASRRASAISSQTNSAASTAPSSVAPHPNSSKFLPVNGAGSNLSVSPLSSVLDGAGSIAHKRNSLMVALTRGDFDDGLMLAEDWAIVVSDGAVSSAYSAYSAKGTREVDCSIGPMSSLYQMKGFCEGAQAYKAGGHWQGVKKLGGVVAGQTSLIGRCIGCGYAHHYDEVGLDINKDPKANFSNSGVRFRIRFLYKSHLITHKMSEAYYACLFCAQAGSTIREGDATVFRSSDALFRHLARHPQPLPDVPGLTVLYGKEFGPDDERLNDYDVHFVNPTAPGGSGIPDKVIPELAKLPVATAIKPHIQRYGEKKLTRPEGFGDKEMLQFFIGARLIGVEFPARWGGKWATAWHDGVWGAFPAKSIELEKPRRHEVPPIIQTAVGTGNNGLGGQQLPALMVTARWKHEPKDAADKGWLVFDKGETIRNVGYFYKDHWCWSGTNPKGKVGVFPRSFVTYDDVKEDVPKLPKVRPSTSSTSKSVGQRIASSKLFSRSKTIDSDGASSVIEIIPR